MAVGQMLEVSTEAMYIEKGISYGTSEATDPFGNPIGTVEFLHVIQQVEVRCSCDGGSLSNGVCARRFSVAHS
jgi:hypothetical protein